MPIQYHALPVTLSDDIIHNLLVHIQRDQNSLDIFSVPPETSLSQLQSLFKPFIHYIKSLEALPEQVQGLIWAENVAPRFPSVHSLFAPSSATVTRFRMTCNSDTAPSTLLKLLQEAGLKWPAISKTIIRDRYRLARPDFEDVRKHTDEWMDAFDGNATASIEQPAKLIKKRKKGAEEDEGEWTVVSRKKDLIATATSSQDIPGKTKGKVATKKFMARQKAQAAGQLDIKSEKKRKQQVVGKDFYSSKKTRAEQKQKDLTSLKTKFQADQAKIAALKTAQ